MKINSWLDTAPRRNVATVAALHTYNRPIMLLLPHVLLLLQDVLQVQLATASGQRLGLVRRLVPADHVDDSEGGGMLPSSFPCSSR